MLPSAGLLCGIKYVKCWHKYGPVLHLGGEEKEILIVELILREPPPPAFFSEMDQHQLLLFRCLELVFVHRRSKTSPNATVNDHRRSVVTTNNY